MYKLYFQFPKCPSFIPYFCSFYVYVQNVITRLPTSPHPTRGSSAHRLSTNLIEDLPHKTKKKTPLMSFRTLQTKLIFLHKPRLRVGNFLFAGKSLRKKLHQGKERWKMSAVAMSVCGVYVAHMKNSPLNSICANKIAIYSSRLCVYGVRVRVCVYTTRSEFSWMRGASSWKPAHRVASQSPPHQTHCAENARSIADSAPGRLAVVCELVLIVAHKKG